MPKISVLAEFEEGSTDHAILVWAFLSHQNAKDFIATEYGYFESRWEPDPDGDLGDEQISENGDVRFSLLDVELMDYET